MNHLNLTSQVRTIRARYTGWPKSKATLLIVHILKSYESVWMIHVN